MFFNFHICQSIQVFLPESPSLGQGVKKSENPRKLLFCKTQRDLLRICIVNFAYHSVRKSILETFHVCLSLTGIKHNKLKINFWWKSGLNILPWISLLFDFVFFLSAPDKIRNKQFSSKSHFVETVLLAREKKWTSRDCYCSDISSIIS